MISVITPVFNGDQHIEACIKSVIDQACNNVEHIIIDGGSTDTTVEIIKQYAKKYPHIVWVSEKDNGQSDAMNKGINMAKGNILSFLNVDDYYEPGALNRVNQLFENQPEPSLLVGNCNVWKHNGSLAYVNRPDKLKITDLLLGWSIHPHPVNPSAYFYHKSLHQQIGLYDINEHFALDLDFLLKAVRAAHVQ
jgi:glycosyltransferase involved in cell wall biosynthesis